MRGRGAPSRRARGLVEAARLISASEHDLEAVLDALAEQARRLLGADGAAIHLVDADGLLVAAGDVLGLLIVDWARATTLTPEKIDMGGALGAHAAVAIRNARLAAEVRRQAARAEHAEAVTAALALARTREEAAAAVLTRGPAAVGATCGAVALLSEGGALELVWIEGEPRPGLEAPAPLALVVDEAAPIFLESPAEIAARFPTAGASAWGSAFGALAALPLVLAGRVIGALGLGFDRPRRFEPEDRRWMITLAQRCTMALERARLGDEGLRNAERYRLAMDLHDEVVRLLAGTMMALAAAGRQVDSDTSAAEAVRRAGEVVGAASDSIRAYVGRLRASAPTEGPSERRTLPRPDA